MFPGFPWLEPTMKGFVGALLLVAVSSACAYFLFAKIPPASPELLRAIAEIGATLLIAYVVEAVWLASRVEVGDEDEEFLGFLVGTGVAGLLGVVLALLLSEHRALGHSNFIDSMGTAWIVISLLILCSLLITQPLFARSAAQPRSGDDLGG